MLSGKARQQRLELGAYNIDAGAAVLAESVVVMGHEYFAELDLAPKTVPDAVDDTQALEELYGAINGSAVNCGHALLIEANCGDRATLGKQFKNALARRSQAIARTFQGFAKSLEHRFSIGDCDGFAKMYDALNQMALHFYVYKNT